MSIKALDWAMDAPVNDPLAKLVLIVVANHHNCLLYTSPSPRDRQKSRMPSSA